MDSIVINHKMMEELAHPNQMFPISEFIDISIPLQTGAFPATGTMSLNCRLFSKASAEYQVNGTPYVVEEGCAIYIAPEAIHLARELSGGTIGYDIVLLPQILINLMRSANCENYTLPLTTRRPEALVITPERKEGHKILEYMRRMYYTESTHFTYELFYWKPYRNMA